MSNTDEVKVKDKDELAKLLLPGISKALKNPKLWRRKNDIL
jgi:hypothetical protein